MENLQEMGAFLKKDREENQASEESSPIFPRLGGTEEPDAATLSGGNNKCLQWVVHLCQHKTLAFG